MENELNKFEKDCYHNKTCNKMQIDQIIRGLNSRLKKPSLKTMKMDRKLYS